MSRKIVVDPAQLDNAATQIDGQAADYERLYNQLFSEVSALGAAWQGKDNTAFVQQIEGFREDFQQMTQLMRDYSDFLKQSSKTYRETQENIVSAAKSLTN